MSQRKISNFTATKGVFISKFQLLCGTCCFVTSK